MLSRRSDGSGRLRRKIRMFPPPAKDFTRLTRLALATLGRGDTVLVPNPSYPIHIYGPVIAGGDIRHVPMTPNVDFFVELENAIHTLFPKPKMLIINFPSNPTAQCVELPFF